MSSPSDVSPEDETVSKDKPLTTCAKCGLVIVGQFVRALGGTYHLDCFKCQDCGEVVAAKFFPFDGPDGKQRPLCERDYFKRLNLICAKCNGALRGSYITALDKKYHIEHFTCSVCPTVFGPQDSYYEHNGHVYCHYHYSTKFAVKCTGCQTAILKQFVEINRNNIDEHWHPECYMIHKFWNVKLAVSNEAGPTTGSESENKCMPEQLKTQQKTMEEKVYNIWTVLSAFEESSAACISDMLLHVSNGSYLDGVKMAEKFIMHVEILFSAIDDLEYQLKEVNGQEGLQHNREAKMLCKKIVNFFSLLSHTSETGVRRLGITQELLSLVTGLAHYLKVLIRIALTGALRLERRYDNVSAISRFLNKLVELATKEGQRRREFGLGMTITSDMCVGCCVTVEEECFRHGQYRWHTNCFKCAKCSRDLTSDLKDAMFDKMAEMVFCPTCATERSIKGFEHVTRLEQYTYLLRVALSRLYNQINRRDDSRSLSDVEEGSNGAARGRKLEKDDLSNLGRKDSRSKSYSSGDKADGAYDPQVNLDGIKRMKSVHLDRKLSTSARFAKRSTIIVHETQPFSDPVVDVDAVSQRERLARAPSQRRIKIVEDRTPERLSIDEDKIELGGNSEALTLADISALAAVEDGGKAAAEKKDRIRRNSRGAKAYLSELSALEFFIVKHVAVLMIEQYLKDSFTLDELLELIGSKKATLWTKFMTSLKPSDTKKIKKKGTFSVPLDVLVERYGVDSVLGAGPGRLRIPSFVDDSISAMKTMDMSVEGIFRKNGNIRRLKDLSEAIDRNPSSVNLSEDNPVQIAALLKKFLRDLPDPLLTFKLHRLFIASQRIESEALRKKVIHLTCCLLPKVNRDTMEVLAIFWKWVATFSHVDEETGSKMDLRNIATVITPNILYSKSKDPVKDESFRAIEAVYSLVKYQDEFCLVPEDLAAILNDQELFNNPEGLTTKDILKRCEYFVKYKQTKGDKMNASSDALISHHETHPSLHQPTYQHPDTRGNSLYASQKTIVGESSIPVEQRAS